MSSRPVFLLLALAVPAGCATTSSSRPPAPPPVPPPQVIKLPATAELAPLADPELKAADELCLMRIVQDPTDPRGYMARGLVRQRAEDLKGALRMYGLAVQADPNYGPAYANQGALLLKAGQAPEALEVLRRGAARAPEHSAIFANLAAALSALEQHPEAAAAAETAVELDSQDADLRRNHAAVLFRGGRLDDAERVLKQALAEFPSDAPDFLMRLQELYVARGDQARAIVTLERVSALVPDAPGPYLRRAALLGRQQDLDGVLLALRDGLKHNPGDPDLQQFFAAAKALRLQRDLEEGVARLQEDRQDAEAYVMVARVHQHGQDLETAQAILRVGVQENPGSAMLWSQLGTVEQSLEREREALAAFRKALQLNPRETVALNNCAFLLATARDRELRDPGEALALVQRALAVEPTNVAFLDTLAEVHFARGEVKDAQRVIQDALRLEPGDGRLLAQARRFQAAAQSQQGRAVPTAPPDRVASHPGPEPPGPP